MPPAPPPLPSNDLLPSPRPNPYSSTSTLLQILHRQSSPVKPASVLVLPPTTQTLQPPHPHTSPTAKTPPSSTAIALLGVVDAIVALVLHLRLAPQALHAVIRPSTSPIASMSRGERRRRRERIRWRRRLRSFLVGRVLVGSGLTN